MNASLERAAAVQSGIRIEGFSIVWMVIEAVVAIGAGLLAHSALLTAFGLDSVIELVSGAILLWRLQVEAAGKPDHQVDQAEKWAARVVSISLALLCVYVLLTALFGLVGGNKAESSPVGIALSVAAVLVMPWLGVTKRRIAAAIQSGALRGDAASSFTCAYMAGTVLIGLILNGLFHWWWAEDVATLLFLFWLVQETREAFEEARGADHDDDD